MNVYNPYTGPVISKKEAKASSLKYYCTGYPCKNGHIDAKYVSSDQCRRCNADRGILFRKNNPEKTKEYNDFYYARDGHKIRRTVSEWKLKNPIKVRASNSKRKAIKKGAVGTYTDIDILKILDLQKNRCAEPTCFDSLLIGYHIDHIMPLSLGGTNWPSNLQCLCPTCNMKKSAKHPDDWARENGRLI